MNVKQAIEEVLKCAKAGQPVLLMGSPGLGKTAIPQVVAMLLGLPYNELRCAEFEPVDFRGVCVPNIETMTTTWLTPDFWPTEACVLNLDEITQASADLTSPLLKLFLGGAVGNYRLPAGTVLIATGNLVSDRAGCQRITSALRERCVVIQVEADAGTWCEWYAEQPDYCPLVLRYIQENPTILHKWDGKLDYNQPTPRNWVRVGKLLKFSPAVETIAGVIGPEQASAFMAWVSVHGHRVTVADFIADGTLPKSPAAAIALILKLADEIVADQHPDDHDKIAERIGAIDGTYQLQFLKHIAQKGGAAVLRRAAYAKLVKRHASFIINAMGK